MELHSQHVELARKRMRGARGLRLIVAALLAALLPAGALADSRFEAFDLRTGAPLFHGRVTVSSGTGLVTEATEYTRADGTPIQQAAATFDPETLRLVAFRSVDLRTGETEAMAAANGEIMLTYRAAANAEEKMERLVWTPDTAFSASITRLIHRNWNALASGGTLTLDLLVPSRLETVRFRVRRESDTTVNGQPVVAMRMEPATWLIRQLVDPLRFFFAVQAPHRLIEYHGRTAVKTQDGQPQDARVVYHPLPVVQ